MADNTKSFADLVKEAPVYTKSNTVTLTGALARSSEEGKFVLVLADGSDVTLETDAVKEHTVLGGSFGQQLVQLSVDAARVPQEVTAQTQMLAPTFTTFPTVDHHTSPFYDQTLPPLDNRTSPSEDRHPPIVPQSYPDANAPFALSTGHHISPETQAAMEAAASSINPTQVVRTGNHWDYVKPPAADGTYPVWINGHLVNIHNDY